MTDVRRRESNGRIAVTVAPTTAPAPRGSARSWPALVHVALLAAVYAGVIAAGSADAWSGSDAGGKVATVRSMADDGSWHPDVGYWAETADPAGQFHPLIKTARHGDDWVQVTSLPLVYAAVPLWRLGGSTAILLLPALGALAAAWSARAVARNLGATTGWSAFWLVGAGSPVLFYAGDFWEHAPALGLFVGAVALLTRPEVGRRDVLLAGAMAGAAAVLRAELGLYLAAFAVGAIAITELRRFWIRRAQLAGRAAAAAAAVVIANTVLERAVVGSAIQSGRVGSQAAAVGGGLADRLQDDVVTTLGLFPYTDATAYALGILAVCGLALLGWVLRHPDERGPALRWGVALTAAAYLARLFVGTGFMAGTLPATPAGSAGLTAFPGSGARAKQLVVTATAAAPAVWLLQWRGDLFAQWGGRYTLASGVLLAVVAAVVIERAGLRTVVAAVVIGASVIVAVFGAAWHAERTRGLAHTIEVIDAAPADVVIVTTMPHLGREAGAFYGDQRWLRLDRPDDADALAAVLDELGVDRIDVVEQVTEGWPHPTLAGFDRAGERLVPYLKGAQLRVIRYERADH